MKQLNPQLKLEILIPQSQVIDKRSLLGIPIDRWDRRENPEIKPTCVWKFFAKDENAVQWSKDSSFNNWC